MIPIINSKSDLKEYMKCDKRALSIKRKFPIPFWDYVWKFEIYLRKHEYYANKHNKNVFDKVMEVYYKFKHNRCGLKLGFSIPINTFGKGLRINHYGYIVVNKDAKIGEYCDIHQGVNIGQNNSSEEVPIIGDGVWIGPGAKIFGKINIDDFVAIGANSVVNNSFLEKNITIAGIPATKIKETGTHEMMVASRYVKW